MKLNYNNFYHEGASDKIVNQYWVSLNQYLPYYTTAECLIGWVMIDSLPGNTKGKKQD